VSRVNWATVWQSVIAGIAVTWPVFFIGLWVNHRKAVQQINSVTQAQTTEVQAITARQTQELLNQLGKDPGE